MQAFRCTCGQPLFFDNLKCLGCGAEVACDPRRRALGPVVPRGDGLWAFQGEAREPPTLFRFCTHRFAAAACNWLVAADEPAAFCLSCSLTRTIPALDRPRNMERLRGLEAAKRRTLFSLLNLKLPIVPKTHDPEGLAFDFMESLPGGPPVLTGHAAGVITLNVAEADDDYRDAHRDLLGEHYRTVIGHLRHELGHYYWDVLVRDTSWIASFRTLFGDERADYAQALARHYAEGPPADWQGRFISRYAAAHPWEDWAETWAQYLHIRSTLETVTAYKLDISQTPLKTTPFGRDALFSPEPAEAGAAFLGWIDAMVVLAAVLNETARSMGQPDIYPFVLNRPTVTKLHFVHCVITGDRASRTPPPPEALAVAAE
ncbi:MAG: hypothetical protein EBR28_05490 [Planctomycetia bacterium]|nr:hypothetical protein [Planctomycetia bacterium]